MSGQTKRTTTKPAPIGGGQTPWWPDEVVEEIHRRCIEFGNIRDIFLTATVGETGGILGCAHLESEVFDALHFINTRALRGFLMKFCSLKYIPVFFVIMETFPRRPDGSIWVEALPQPDPPSRSESAPPRTPLQHIVASLFYQLLPHLRGRPIGVHENFFRLGGDLILLNDLAELIRRHFQISIQPRDLFCIPSIAEIARWIGNTKKKSPSGR